LILPIEVLLEYYWILTCTIRSHDTEGETRYEATDCIRSTVTVLFSREKRIRMIIRAAVIVARF